MKDNEINERYLRNIDVMFRKESVSIYQATMILLKKSPFEGIEKEWLLSASLNTSENVYGDEATGLRNPFISSRVRFGNSIRDPDLAAEYDRQWSCYHKFREEYLRIYGYLSLLNEPCTSGRVTWIQIKEIIDDLILPGDYIKLLINRLPLTKKQADKIHWSTEQKYLALTASLLYELGISIEARGAQAEIEQITDAFGLHISKSWISDRLAPELKKLERPTSGSLERSRKRQKSKWKSSKI